MLDIREEMLKYLKKLPDTGWVIGTSGNLSVRDADDNIIITPSGVDYGSMKKEDLFLVRPDGTLEGGLGHPTSSLRFHVAVMKDRPDVNVVLHTHAPHAIAASALGETVSTLTLSVFLRLGGAIPVSKYAENGSDEEAWNVVQALGQKYWAVLMQNHGPISLGKDLEDAWLNMGYIEECCHAYMHCLSTGKKISYINL